MMTIALEGMQFYAYHGLYPEETILGNHFTMDILVKVPPPADPSNLDESVNYEVIHQIARDIMRTPHPLLETIVHDISAQLKTSFPHVSYSKVTLRKQAPPMGGDIGRSVVALEKTY